MRSIILGTLAIVYGIVALIGYMSYNDNDPIWLGHVIGVVSGSTVALGIRVIVRGL